MVVVFRVDASETIGIGHIYRCLTLAEELSKFGAIIHFISNLCHKEIQEKIINLGFYYHAYPAKNINNSVSDYNWEKDLEFTYQIIKQEIKKVDLFVLDKYELDEKWEKQVSKLSKYLLVIDDLENRKHFCNLMLNQSIGIDKENYNNLVNKGCNLFLGPDYALLKKEFLEMRSGIEKEKQINNINILISMGGYINNTCKKIIMDVIDDIDNKIEIHFITGSEHEKELIYKELFRTNDKKVHIYGYISNIASLMKDADIVIGAGGISTWERCCLGKASIVLMTAKNQGKNIIGVTERNAAIGIDISNDTRNKLKKILNKLILDHEFRNNISMQASRLCDGFGIGRLIFEILDCCTSDGRKIRLRRANETDAELIYKWQKLPETRRYARNILHPSWDKHRIWYNKKLSDIKCIFNIILCDDKPAGVFRLDYLKQDQTIPVYEVSIYLEPKYYQYRIASKVLNITKTYMNWAKFYAEVSKDNESSNALFTSLGYSKEHNGYIL